MRNATRSTFLPTPGLFDMYLHGDPVRWVDLPDADGNGIAWRVTGDCTRSCRASGCALATR